MTNDECRETGWHLTNNAARTSRRRCLRLFLFFGILFLSLADTAHSSERGSARAYFYIEPNSARFECLVPLPEMMILLGQSPESLLAVEAQQILRDAARERVADWLRVKVDGIDSPSSETFRVMIVKGVPGRTDVLKANETVSSAEAMLGLVWEFDLAAVPEKIEVAWTGFGENIPSLVTSIITGSQSEEHELTAGAPSCEWINRGRLTMQSPLALVPPLPPMETIRIPVVSLLWVIFGLVIFSLEFRKGQKASGKLMMLMIGILLGAVILWPVASANITPPWHAVAAVSTDQAERILSPLLRNVYRAFDQRQESAIYDVLARSIEGDLLPRIYLQTINALTLDAQDATRARVTDLDVQVESVRMTPGSHGFIADVQWTALGTVGHWGHQHQRINRYTAKVTVGAVPVGNGKSSEWKVGALDVEQETRM